MTNQEALVASVNYPVNDNVTLKCLADHSISASGSYSSTSKDFELAIADLLLVLVTSANVSEGGMSIAPVEKKMLLSRANSIYAKHGVAPTTGNPTVSNRSYLW